MCRVLHENNYLVNHILLPLLDRECVWNLAKALQSALSRRTRNLVFNHGGQDFRSQISFESLSLVCFLLIQNELVTVLAFLMIGLGFESKYHSEYDTLKSYMCLKQSKHLLSSSSMSSLFKNV